MMETAPRAPSAHEQATEELVQQICALADEVRNLRERLKPVSRDELAAAPEETPEHANISPAVKSLFESAGRVRSIREVVRFIESALDI